VPLPPQVDLIFAVLLSDGAGAGAAAFFCWSRPARAHALILADCEVGVIGPDMLKGAVEKLWQLLQQVHAAHAMVFTSGPLAAELQRLGYTQAVETIDGVLDDDLSVAAAIHIGAQRVRVSDAVLRKPYPLRFLNPSREKDSDDLLLRACMAGVCCAFDEGRSAARRHGRAA
jgi:hypothetical protein